MAGGGCGEGEGGLYFSSRHKRKQLFKSWVCDLKLTYVLDFVFFTVVFYHSL